MLRALWYIIKVGVFVAAVVWLADRPGVVTLEWMDYTLRVKTGVFLAALVIVILMAIFIYQIIRAVANVPRAYRRYRQMTNREKGHRALALGLTAVAAGDAKIASYQAYRAAKFLPSDKGMPLLLRAQAERLNGNEEGARQVFEAMLENRDTAFLGVRGLLQGALDAKDYPKALGLAQRGLNLYPKQKWMLRIAYDLEIKTQDWNGARKLLLRAEKVGAVERIAARSDRMAMLMIEGQDLLKQGFRVRAVEKFVAVLKIDPLFVPAVEVLARVHKQDGRVRKAVKLVEKIWVRTGHAVIAALWMEMFSPAKGDDRLERLKWAERLVILKPDYAEGQLIVARAAMEAALWGEARGHLEKAGEVLDDSRLYMLRAEIEKRSVHDDVEAAHWLEKAAAAPPPRVWVCRETGRVYDAWQPIAYPHGAFNTIQWDFPAVTAAAPVLHLSGGDVLLELPQV